MCGGGGGGRLTGVVEGAVVLEQHHLAMEVDDLLAHPHELLLGLPAGRPGHPVLQFLLHPATAKQPDQIKESFGKRGEGRKESRHLLADDVLLFLLDEERVELVELGLQEPHKVRLLRRHRRRRRGRVRLPGVVAAGPLRLPLGGPVPGSDELEALLEVLVGEELVAPLRERLHDLPAQALAELHRRRRRRLLTAVKKMRFPGGGGEWMSEWVCGWTDCAGDESRR